ncbi:hypothetical protein NDI44_08685 [Trichocoleus sp. DQ-A3]|uniref:hypothetical protein n=1 Tax=Cyanophyceae TaxID=3028117 RepID=UPI001686E984|nr:hypothetical protein [Coleofasciculus sp. FACHB-125]MBD1899267.1 hypothetical protein [Coleofasciculus sp. FACHB-125]
MAVYTHSKVYNIAARLRPNSSNIMTLYENFGDLPHYIGRKLEVLAVNTYLKNLKCHSMIKSIPSGNLPRFEVADTETDRLGKTLQTEWGSARKHLDVYYGVGDSDWLPVGAASLLAPFGYPFRVHNLLDLFTDNLAAELGTGSRIGVAIADVDYGLLDTNDSVVIHGSYVTEYVTTEADLPSIQHSEPFNHVVLPTSGILLGGRGERKQFTITNAGTKPAYLNFGDTATARKGIYLAAGGSYEYNTDNYPYFGEVSAVCLPEHESQVFLVGMECW